MKNVISVLFLLIGAACAQDQFKICATEMIIDSTCSALRRSRSTSQVSCVRVIDSADCAIKLAEGKADFGIFTAEEMLLAYQFYPDQLELIAQLRHPDRLEEDFLFQSVAVVPSDFDGRDGLKGLKNGGFCHPGFTETGTWNDLVLKYFEKKVYDAWCRSDMSASQNEAENLRTFFGSACRPGKWVSDGSSQDRKLKSKYPELCALCDNKPACKYNNVSHDGHFGALDCLVSRRGKVAYVAYEYVKQYFKLNGPSMEIMSVPIGFQFLCADGTTRPLTSTDPCAWVKQPWSTILARKDAAVDLLKGLNSWLAPTAKAQDWTDVLNSIIQKAGKPIYFSQKTNLKTYLTNGRDVELPKNTCGEDIRWCTISEPETNKCKWVAMEALALGIEPSIKCVEIANSTFGCLKNIAEGRADVIAIDSNYGYLARHVFNLTTMMYAESDRNNKVIAVVRDDVPNKISSFHELKNRTACFPEYGGIAWLAFLNTLHTTKIISDCSDYPETVSNFLSGACTPGIKDANHSIGSVSSNASAILCSLCRLEKTNVTCSANENNNFYGDKGALKCVNDGGDIGFIETNHFMDESVNPNDYRVLCKNGSLAIYTGFNVDEQCALSVTIDSEVVSRKENSEVFSTDVTLALLNIEKWLSYHSEIARPIRVYDSFNGSDLLFKDSTIGLVSTSSEIKTVLAYKELFSNVESCSSVGTIIANIFTVFLMVSIPFALFH